MECVGHGVCGGCEVMYKNKWEKFAYDTVATIIVLSVPTALFVGLLFLLSSCGMRGDI